MRNIFRKSFTLVGLLAGGLALAACSAPAAVPSPQIIQQTVVVVITATPQPVSPTPIPQPTDAVPPTPLPVLPSATPAPALKPSPTPLQLVNIPIEGGDPNHMFFARLVFPDYRPAATTSVEFQVYAHSPMNAAKDGQGIQLVEFWIFDQNDDQVYDHVELNPSYCAFGGDGPTCTAWDFASNGFKWPDGSKIKSGRYTIKVVITSNDNVDMIGQTYFQVQAP